MFSNAEKEEMSKKNRGKFSKLKLQSSEIFFLCGLMVGHEHWTLLNMTF